MKDKPIKYIVAPEDTAKDINQQELTRYALLFQDQQPEYTLKECRKIVVWLYNNRDCLITLDNNVGEINKYLYIYFSSFTPNKEGARLLSKVANFTVSQLLSGQTFDLEDYN